MPVDDSCEQLMFLNSLSDFAAKQGIDGTELNRLREEQKDHLVAGKRSATQRLLTGWRILCSLFLPMFSLLFCVRYEKTLESTTLLYNPLTTLFECLASVICVFSATYFALLWITNRIEKLFNACQKHQFEKQAAQISESDWQAYRIKQQEDAEQRHEQRAAEFRQITENRMKFEEAPRKLDCATGWAIMLSDEGAKAILFLFTFFSPLLFVVAFLGLEDVCSKSSLLLLFVLEIVFLALLMGVPFFTKCGFAFFA